MIILAIETSCDDTGIAVIEKKNGKLKTLASAISSQIEIHKKWGGVYPSEAKREHQKNLIPTLKKTLRDSSLLIKGSLPKPEKVNEILSREPFLLEETEKFFSKHKIGKIDAIAVTVGPGLEPCLWVGINFARTLSLYLNSPIIPVNHIKAHILFFLLEKEKIKFPSIALIASGGHTELVLMKSLNRYEVLGKTRDDAAGECFDKTARILGLDYPGGPAIAKEASLWKPQTSKNFEIKLPRPMRASANYDFSFSGLKTAVLYDFLSRTKREQKNRDYIITMAKEIEDSITDVLVFKLKKAIKSFGAKTVILGGGVTANKTLRKKVRQLRKDFEKTEFLLPPFSLSTDNGKVIGAAASIEKKRKKQEKVVANANLKIYDKL